MSESRKQLVEYFENISVLVIGALLLVFPILFLSSTTDNFILPKEFALCVGVTIVITLFGIKTLVEGKLKIKSSPFDLPVTLFVLVSFLSAFFSANKYDALASFVPLLFIAFLYFSIVNLIREDKQLLCILGALVAGAAISSLISIFSFFKIYPLPMDYTHIQFFTTFGSFLDQAIYVALVLPITGYIAYSLILGKHTRSLRNAGSVSKRKMQWSMPGFFLGFIVLIIGLAITLYTLFTSQKPVILPFDTGLQTGFAAISQDSTQVLKSFLLGSGIGTYLTDFTRFKTATYNTNPTLWSFTFFRSSNYVLELLATVGVLGLASYIFLLVKILKEKNYFLPLILAAIASVMLPFSFTLVTLFFILVAIFAVLRINANPDKYNEVEFYLVAFKKGLFAAVPEGEKVTQNTMKKYNKFLPWVFIVFVILVVGIPMYFATRFFLSDLTFQKSLVAASENNGLQTYNLQTAAIKMFPYRDIYYRGFSQTNLALANALAINQQRSGKADQQTQQNIVTLIQQAINGARSATTIAPLTTFNWNNLSSIYRALIGFGQNADKFTILTSQQAIALDPNNPQQYVELGGVYYQLGSYDDALRQFQTAINMKSDYANAYYNAGHALEAKGDLQGALQEYQTVKRLIANDAANNKKISDEIDALTKKIAEEQNSNKNQEASNTKTATESATTTREPAQQQQLNVNEPNAQLPAHNPKVKIPAPTVAPQTASPTPTE